MTNETDEIFWLSQMEIINVTVNSRIGKKKAGSLTRSRRVSDGRKMLLKGFPSLVS